jgi:hypothetical protein
MDFRLTTVVVALLVVLAGCGGGTTTQTDGAATETTVVADQTPTPTPGADGGDTTPTPGSDDSDTTPTPTPGAGDGDTTPTPTPEPGSESGETGTPTPVENLQPVSAMSSLPDGVSSEKVTNVSRLFSAQDERLGDVGFTQTILIRNESQSGSATELRIANDTAATTAVISSAGVDWTQEYYLGSEVTGAYNGSTGSVQYGVGPTNVERSAGFVIGIFSLIPRGYIGALEWETAGTYTTDDGERRLVLTADSRNESSSYGGFFAPSITSDGETLQSVTGRMEVTSEGVIRSATVTATVQGAGGSTYAKGTDLTISSPREQPVEEPSWLADKPTPSLSTSSDARLLVYEHAGDQPLSAGTNLTVTTRDLVGIAQNVTLDQSVAPGETVYVYKTGEGTQTTIRGAVGQQPSLSSNATAFSGRVVVSVPLERAQTELQMGIEIEEDEEN